MKIGMVSACITASILFGAVLAVEGLENPRMVGGYSAASVTKAEVVAAAAFAIKAKQEAMQKDEATRSARLTLVKILGAQEQVVAGMNYRLTLKVELDGAEKEAEAVVWWQAWRSPDPYQLTSWIWK